MSSHERHGGVARSCLSSSIFCSQDHLLAGLRVDLGRAEEPTLAASGLVEHFSAKVSGTKCTGPVMVVFNSVHIQQAVLLRAGGIILATLAA